jgi:hypothetical protein
MDLIIECLLVAYRVARVSVIFGDGAPPSTPAEIVPLRTRRTSHSSKSRSDGFERPSKTAVTVSAVLAASTDVPSIISQSRLRLWSTTRRIGRERIERKTPDGNRNKVTTIVTGTSG